METPNVDTTSELAGTVKFYRQHVIVCSGRGGWPAQIQQGDAFIGALQQAIADANLPGPIRLTACDAPSSGRGIDLLLYPQQVRLIGLQTTDIPAVIKLLAGESADHLAQERLAKALFLVCGHAERDPRCGRCGPPLQRALERALAARGLSDAAEVRRSSHLGGHRFAPVLVCYPSGNWYGRVATDDLMALLQAELGGAARPVHLWRGQMGMSTEEQLALATKLHDRNASAS